jgi:DNA-binding MarR family transcriptional regulator
MGEARIDTATAVSAAALRASLRTFLRGSEKIARASGLTPQRYLLLLMIKGAPDGSEQATVTELAKRLELAQSTVTELVRRAEALGLVTRERSEADGRVAHLRLTSEGEGRLAKTLQALEDERKQLRQAVEALNRVERRQDRAPGH